MSSETITRNDLKAILENICLATVAYGRGEVGEIKAYGGSTIPAGWLLCNGQAVSRTTYAELFSVIGTTYGSGDGSTTFNIPDLRGKFPIGANTTYPLGDTGGAPTVTLTTNEMPAHTHVTYTDATSQTGWQGRHNITYGTNGLLSSTYAWLAEGTTVVDVPNITSTGEGQAHENMPPYIAINYIIYAKNTVTMTNPSLNMFYPVGSYYETSDSTFDPNIAWGGTWTLMPQHVPIEQSVDSITLVASGDTEVCTLTLDANTRYIILASAGTGSGTSMTSNCDISLKSGTYNTWLKFATNSTTSSAGATLNASAYIYTNTSCVVSLNKYNYTTSAITTGNGRIVAIPLSGIDETTYRWHRTV